MSRTTRAFTIIELLVVIAVIGVLSAILLPAVSNVRRTAARTQDQSNQRQLVLGTINYADTRKGQIMSGNTQREVYLGGNSQYLRDKVCDAWVNANPSNPDLDGDCFGDYFIPLDEDQCVLTESPFAIEEGVLFPYVGDAKAYISPQDPYTRGRSYSFNGYLGKFPDSYVFEKVVDGAAGVIRNPAERLSNLVSPECTMAFVGEEQQGLVNSSFANVNTGGWPAEGCVDENNVSLQLVTFNWKGFIMDPLSPLWIDIPALWNPDGVNISYMDGRVDYYTWQNPGAVKRLLKTRLFDSNPADDTNNWIPGDAIIEDTRYFQSLMAPGLGNAFFPQNQDIADLWPTCP